MAFYIQSARARTATVTVKIKSNSLSHSIAHACVLIYLHGQQTPIMRPNWPKVAYRLKRTYVHMHVSCIHVFGASRSLLHAVSTWLGFSHSPLVEMRPQKNRIVVNFREGEGGRKLYYQANQADYIASSFGHFFPVFFTRCNLGMLFCCKNKNCF